MKIGLVLTNDWELYGDGSGDYFSIQHEPLEQLLAEIEAQKAKLTIMAEVGQQWAFLNNNDDFSRKVSFAWEKILQSAVARGHDVQLHYHPQWSHSRFEGNHPILDFGKWTFSSLSTDEIRNVLENGKKYLETLLQPMRSDYRCIAFRAGAYCIQPSEKVIPLLLETGFLCDSSVIKGIRDRFFDYRTAHSNILPWFASRYDVQHSGETSLLEIPIHTRPFIDFPLLRKFVFGQKFYDMLFDISTPDEDSAWQARNAQVLKERYPLKNRPFMNDNLRSLSWILKKFAAKTALQLDYDHLTPQLFVQLLARIFNDSQTKHFAKTDIILPVVATGHVKSMMDTRNIHRIIAETQRTFGENVIFWTLQEAVEYWLDQKKLG